MAIIITGKPVLYGFQATFLDDDTIDVIEVWQVKRDGGYLYAEVQQNYASDGTSTALEVDHQAAIIAAYAALGATVSFA